MTEGVRWIILSVALFPVLLWAQERDLYSDPSHPGMHIDQVEPKSVALLGIPSRINEVAEELDRLKSRLEMLPQAETSLQVNEFGYHSDYLPVLDTLPASPRWTIEFVAEGNLGSLDLVLVPTVDPRVAERQNYGFPRRFRIVSLDGEVVYVDWTAEDFPDPGLVPVYLQLADFRKEGVRLEVFAGAVQGDLEYFSLSRVYMVRKNEIRFVSRIKSSSELSSLPYWSTEYLNEGKFTVGLPLGSEPLGRDDFVLPVSPEMQNGELAFEFDFGKNTHVGWVNLLPAKNPEGLAIPGYGFPKSLKLEVIPEDEAGGRGAAKVFYDWNSIQNPGDNLLRFRGYNSLGRYLRITFRDFAVYGAEAVFAMAEVEMYRSGKYFGFVDAPKVSLSGTPLGVDASRLIDKTAHGHASIAPSYWLNQLASTKPILRDIDLLEQEKQDLEIRWSRAKVLIFWCFIALLFILIIGVFAALAHGRRKEKIAIRRQISADLHDDISSSVAAIGLAAQSVERSDVPEAVLETASRIKGISSRMFENLRDVIWLTDAKTDTLPDLLEKLASLARNTVAEEQLVLTLSGIEDAPNIPLKMQTKRNILMFAKEALNNAKVHAQATRIEFGLEWSNRSLRLSIADDGQGFDLEAIQSKTDGRYHHGLGNLSERAKQLGDQLEMYSELNAGTQLTLTVSRSALK
ncbi:MAG: histidine kinase [Opitutales bacterium]